MVTETRSQTRSQTRSLTRTGHHHGLAGLEQEDFNAGFMPSSAAATAKSPSGRKRKTDDQADAPTGTKRKATDAPDQDDDGDDDQGFTKVVGKRARATKAAATKKAALQVAPLFVATSKFTKNNFKRGTIIRLVTHAPNTDPKATVEDDFLRTTAFGGVYSKIRYAVVLWRFSNHMIVIPMYSFGSIGITKQDPETFHEYIEITNSFAHAAYVKQGVHSVLSANMDGKINRPSCLHLAKAFSVDYAENVQIIGSLSWQSQLNLMDIVNGEIDTCNVALGTGILPKGK